MQKRPTSMHEHALACCASRGSAGKTLLRYPQERLLFWPPASQSARKDHDPTALSNERASHPASERRWPNRLRVRQPHRRPSQEVGASARRLRATDCKTTASASPAAGSPDVRFLAVRGAGFLRQAIAPTRTCRRSTSNDTPLSFAAALIDAPSLTRRAAAANFRRMEAGSSGVIAVTRSSIVAVMEIFLRRDPTRRWRPRGAPLVTERKRFPPTPGIT